ncbi:DUF6162 family protein [Bordetella petrii]|uniref:DUF6162 family protein n=1 Tax=Bordetella petrii TaxID=94624 RepID=UPI001E365994|nr:DUF6162 family protein [Bordetella petrii]MCD0503952.1 DUF6162 family protein [Bordetella petrii]
MPVQVVRPAGAGHETLAVLLASLLIVAAAAAYIGLRPARVDSVALAATQIDARRDLTPAEQGVYADLRVAYDEIAFALQGGETLPSAAELASQGLPPFVADNSSAARGGHRWSLQHQNGHAVYLGLSADAGLAGSFAMRVPAAAGGQDPHAHPGHTHDELMDVWLNRDAAASLPDPADDAALAAAGWRQVVAQFDGGVTRQGNP